MAPLKPLSTQQRMGAAQETLPAPDQEACHVSRLVARHPEFRQGEQHDGRELGVVSVGLGRRGMVLLHAHGELLACGRGEPVAGSPCVQLVLDPALEPCQTLARIAGAGEKLDRGQEGRRQVRQILRRIECVLAPRRPSLRDGSREDFQGREMHVDIGLEA